jgi:hypothetical protein
MRAKTLLWIALPIMAGMLVTGSGGASVTLTTAPGAIFGDAYVSAGSYTVALNSCALPGSGEIALTPEENGIPNIALNDGGAISIPTSGYWQMNENLVGDGGGGLCDGWGATPCSQSALGIRWVCARAKRRLGRPTGAIAQWCDPHCPDL